MLKKTFQLCYRFIELCPGLGSWMIEAQWADINFLELVFEIIGMVSRKLSLRSFACVPPRWCRHLSENTVMSQACFCIRS